jgi:hypothetical protein
MVAMTGTTVRVSNLLVQGVDVGGCSHPHRMRILSDDLLILYMVSDATMILVVVRVCRTGGGGGGLCCPASWNEVIGRLKMLREKLELKTAYLREIYAYQALLGWHWVGNWDGGGLGGSGAGLFSTTLRVDNTLLLLGQGKSRACVVPHRALITYGRTKEDLATRTN